MKLFLLGLLFVIVIVLNDFVFIGYGAVLEAEAIPKDRMRLSRKYQLIINKLFYFLTFGKYYICDECRKIHRKFDNDIQIETGIRIAKNCRSEKPKNVSVYTSKNLKSRQELAKDLYDISCPWLQAQDKPTVEYQRFLVQLAAERLMEDEREIGDLKKKLYF